MPANYNLIGSEDRRAIYLNRGRSTSDETAIGQVRPSVGRAGLGYRSGLRSLPAIVIMGKCVQNNKARFLQRMKNKFIQK